MQQKCISAYDLDRVTKYFQQDELGGLESLSQELEQVVIETIETGKVVEPPERETETPVAPKKTKAKKTKGPEASQDQNEDAGVKVKEEDVEMEDAPSPAVQEPKNSRAKKHSINQFNGSHEPEPKPIPKKTRTKKRAVKKVKFSSESEPEYVPKKSRCRSVPFKERVNLTEAAIAGLQK